MGLSGKYENEDRRWLSQYLPKEQSELPPRSMNVSVCSNKVVYSFIIIIILNILKFI